MNSNMQPLALRLPLHGQHWIEASAGTGKTFTLSLLVLRCLLSRGLSLPKILIVTYTNAATNDLKIKIRDDIAYALHFLIHEYDASNHTPNKKQQLFYALLHEAISHANREKIKQRLVIALQDYDRASIYSIHGFCSHVINEHALLLGESLHEDELLTQTALLYHTIALTIWRELSIDKHWAVPLLNLWDSPSALARQLDVLLRAEYLWPEPNQEIDININDAAMTEAHRILRQAIENNMQASKESINHAIAEGWMHKRNFSKAIADASFEKLLTWYVQNTVFPIDDPDIHRLSIEKLKQNAGKNKDKFPSLPLFLAVQTWQDAYQHWLEQQEYANTACLHHVHVRAKQLRAQVLSTRQQKTYDDLISKVFDAMQDPHRRTHLIQSLREAYPVAMVDEFQDTDNKQWQIFAAIYLSDIEANAKTDIEHALYLVGDPKQAIYGFRGGDVHAYLAAKQAIVHHAELRENFRARPSLISSINACFSIAGANPFLENEIQFTPVTSGGMVQEQDFLLDGATAPALCLAVLADQHTEDASPLAMPKRVARELAANACANKICELLNSAEHDKAVVWLRDVPSKLKPDHIAVLVNTHVEASLMQSALKQRGIPAVTASQQSIFDTEQAVEIRLLLEALIYRQDVSRWRGALSGVLLGYSAEQLLLLDHDAQALQASTLLRVQSLERWRTQGVLSMLRDLCASAAPRLLLLNDGERRLSNYLQMAETLQEISAELLGPEALYQWLCQQLADNQLNDDEHTLRLDSDEHRVKIFTIHKSKGLEFPLVFLPFISLHKTQHNTTSLSVLQYHNEQHQRISHVLIAQDKKRADQQQARALAIAEQEAEQMRLLYVAMTRAQHYLWLCCGYVKESEFTAFVHLLGIDDKPQTQAQILARFAELGFTKPDVSIEKLPQTMPSTQWKNQNKTNNTIELSTPSSSIQRDWRVHSFSALSEQLNHPVVFETSAAVALTEPERVFAGRHFGNALHDVLEHVEPKAWSDVVSSADIPEKETKIIALALQQHGFANHDTAMAVSILGELARHTLQSYLPEGVRLCDLPSSHCRKEMEFYFSLQETNIAVLWRLLQSHQVLQDEQSNQNFKSMSGLMTGKIDLIYEHKQKFYILDYKSNRLVHYDHAHCHAAMHQHQYYFQALIYTLALHRWCRFNMGGNYRYEKHIGGVRYLFCRGLNADDAADQSGLIAFRFEQALIEALETMLHPLQELSA